MFEKTAQDLGKISGTRYPVNAPVSRAVNANHAYLKDDKPSLLAGPVRATGFRKIYSRVSVLEVLFLISKSC